MSLRRLLAVHRVERRHFSGRPITWILLLLLFLIAWGLAAGNVTISSGDSTVGGDKAWMTSEFALAQILCLLVFLCQSFFIAIAVGMILIRDEEDKVGEVLHSTPLTCGEYVWGKFSAVLLGFLGVLLLQVGFHAFANHVLAGAKSEEYVGPFVLGNYLRPALIFCAPLIVFLCGVSFALGAISRRPILVFAFPIALLVVTLFLMDWSPSWLDPRIDRALMLVEPTGLRWLDHTWLKTDRGVAFYNSGSIGLDAPFVASRIAFIALGLLAVDLGRRKLARDLRGVRSATARRRLAASSGPEAVRAAPVATMGSLGMTAARPGFLATLGEVTRVELIGLRNQPGLYLFVPLILLQVIGSAFFAVGAFDTPLLHTPGEIAARSMNTITLLVTLLLLFYTVESLQRERSTGLDAIHYATPVRSASVLFGKTLANGFVGAVVLLGALLAAWIVLLAQGTVPFDLGPFALLWGLLLVPTFLVWSSFVAAVFALFRNRYATYAVGLVALVFTGYLQTRGEMNWVGNWDLWSAVRWSDMSVLELDRRALVLNRLLALSLTLLFTVLAVRLFPRRASDATSALLRLRPVPLLRAAWGLAPFWSVPLALGIFLYHEVQDGSEGDHRDKQAKDYWRKNVSTWLDADVPDVTGVALDLEIDPGRSWIHSRGTLTLENRTDGALRQLPVTPGFAWEELEWTLAGRSNEHEDRAGLHVFDLDPPLAPGDDLELSFDFESRVPSGISQNGGGREEFILPGGVVLTSFGTSFAPLIGFVDGIGVDEENAHDARKYPDDFYEGVTKSAMGPSMPFTTRVRITAPEAYRMNSVGVLVEDQVADGKRTVLWESDQPVYFYNVVGGIWDVHEGESTTIYYHPDHAWNIERMSTTLDAARRWYSEWFHPYPWKELKLSEFPALAGYAQGFPTNIPFSEGIGFLTEDDPKADAVFMVTAHESAHQWWPNLVIPGKGPGGNVLSEGMAHFSTILLTEEVQGLGRRIAFCKQIEEQYGDRRQVDSEQPLVKLDDTRAGDETVTYDKGGWVMWMLLDHMGRESALAGLRAFIDRYHGNEDHPALQDLVATLRPFAADAEAFDAFCAQWFFDVVVPEYRLSDAKHERIEAADGEGETWEVRVRVENAGTGRMPLEVAASRGERFPELEEDAKPEKGSVQAAEPADPTELYREAKVSIVLGAGEAEDVVIRCPFEPEQVLVDPDARVLQLERDKAIVRF